MLTYQEIAERLNAAMDWREPRIPSVLVARKCGVTPQAVSKWRKDGHIDFKDHLLNLASATQVTPMFYLEPERGQSEETRAIWHRLVQPAELAFDISKKSRQVPELNTQCTTGRRLNAFAHKFLQSQGLTQQRIAM